MSAFVVISKTEVVVSSRTSVKFIEDKEINNFVDKIAKVRMQGHTNIILVFANNPEEALAKVCNKNTMP